MSSCNPFRTPADTQTKLDQTGTPIKDLTLYHSLAGGLQHLTFTRPDITYVVQQICLYMHDPHEPHFHALKRILRYIQGTIDHDLQIHLSCTTSLIAYFDANWGDVPLIATLLVVIVSISTIILFPGHQNAKPRFPDQAHMLNTRESPMS